MTIPLGTVRLPTFLLAGASKAGTTSLRDYIGQHPQVFISSIKEPTFFGAADLLADPYRERILRGAATKGPALRAYLAGPQPRGAKYLVLDWTDYVQLFRDVRQQTAIGEASTGYLWMPSAAAAIRETLPDIRLLFVLRDPAQRLHAFYTQALWQEPRLTFRDWFDRTLLDPQVGPAIVGAGQYASHLQRFLDRFPRQQMRIYLFEDYCKNPEAIVRDALEFVGVDSSCPIDVSTRYNETLTPRFAMLHKLRRRLLGDVSLTGWLPSSARKRFYRFYGQAGRHPTMDPNDRRFSIEYYRREILTTANIIGRDLSAWLH